jgi:hypothetical protein
LLFRHKEKPEAEKESAMREAMDAAQPLGVIGC